MHHSQQGFTLTELLVSLTISAILLLSISTFLIAGKTSWKTQLRLTSSQEIERFSVIQLRRAIRQAYAIDLNSQPLQLILTYVAGEGSRNCLGQLQVAGESYSDRFHVSGDQLRCNGQGLISGVKSIVFAYGVDMNDNGQITSAEYFSTPHHCCPVRSVEFELSLSGINETQAPFRYSATVRRY